MEASGKAMGEEEEEEEGGLSVPSQVASDSEMAHVGFGIQWRCPWTTRPDEMDNKWDPVEVPTGPSTRSDLLCDGQQMGSNGDGIQ